MHYNRAFTLVGARALITPVQKENQLTSTLNDEVNQNDNVKHDIQCVGAEFISLTLQLSYRSS